MTRPTRFVGKAGAASVPFMACKMILCCVGCVQIVSGASNKGKMPTGWKASWGPRTDKPAMKKPEEEAEDRLVEPEPWKSQCPEGCEDGFVAAGVH
jgi:hypothetical protein